MEKTIRIIDRITDAFGIVAGCIMILGMMMVMTEVFARMLFNSTIYITGEYSAYFMVAITYLGLAYTLKDKGHIRMVFLHKLIKGGKPRLILDLYAFIIGFVLFIVITVLTFNYFWDSLITGSHSMQISQTYLAIPQLSMPVGSLLIALQFLAEILRTITLFNKGEMDKVESESQGLGR